MTSVGEQPILALGGYPIASTTADQLSATLCQRMALGKQTALVFANTNFVVSCRSERRWLKQEPALIVNDGVGMDLAAMVIHGRRYRENLNGTDFVPLLLARLNGPHKLFLLGGKPGVARTASAAITRLGHQVVGCADGYAGLKSPTLIQEMNACGADIVLIALGNPLQEQWMAEHLSSLNARLLIGVGALFDFLSGDKQRAPRWVRRLRCEWLFRLCLEPRRLLRRYTLDVLMFFFLCLRYRKQAD